MPNLYVEIGYDCDFMLWHKDTGFEGFLFYDDRYSVDLTLGRQMDESMMVVRTDSGDGIVENKLQLVIRVGEAQQGPGGAMRTYTRQEEKNLVYSILRKETKLAIVTVDGVWLGLEVLDNIVNETLFPEFTVMILTFKSTTKLKEPIDRTKWENSIWWPGGGGDPSIEWSQEGAADLSTDGVWS